MSETPEEFIARKSGDLLKSQIESFSSTHTRAGTLIGINALFVPTFLFLIEKGGVIIQYLSVLTIIGFGISTGFMLSILYSKLMNYGLNVKKFDELVNMKYEDLLLFEIGANRESFKDNERIVKIQKGRFNKGLIVTVISIFVSILLLTCNVFIKKSGQFMSEEKKEQSKQEKPKESQEAPKKVIPTVPKEDRTQLNKQEKPK